MVALHEARQCLAELVDLARCYLVMQDDYFLASFLSLKLVLSVGRRCSLLSIELTQDCLKSNAIKQMMDQI